MSFDKKECNSRPAEVVLEEFAEWMCHPANIKKLWKIAQSVQSKGKILLETDDLVAGGILYLLKEIRRIEDKKEHVDDDIEKFVTRWFHRRVIEYYRKDGINQKDSEKIKILVEEKKEKELHKHLNIKLCSVREKLSEDEKRKIRNLIHIKYAGSLDATFSESSGNGEDCRTLHDILPGNARTPEVILHERRLALGLKECIELWAQENNWNATILYLVFEQDMTQKEVAKILGLSEVRISQLKKNARKKLRDCMNKKGIPSEELPQE